MIRLLLETKWFVYFGTSVSE